MHDIAILHDCWTEMGGAERVAHELARTFDAPIYAAKVDAEKVPDDIEVREAFTRWFEHRAMDSHYLVQDFLQMFGWQHVPEVYEYDTVILNKNNPGWFVPKDDQTVVKYTHTTPRHPYDQFHEHGESYVSRLMKTPMRVLYWPNRAYPDAWVTNSELIQRRLNRYWNIPEEEVSVVYPPTAVDEYGPEHAAGSEREYYFTLSRLCGHKRIDQIVEAFRGLPHKRLMVAGDGPQRDALEADAPDNVQFLGYISEDEKRHRLAACNAFVMNAENEDFGLSVIEAFASGTPVLGVEEGYTQHQIVPGKNGYTYARGVGDLRDAIRRFEQVGVQWEPDRIQTFAERFSAESFRRRMRAIVADAQQDAAVEPAWADDIQPVDADESDPQSERERVIADGGGL